MLRYLASDFTTPCATCHRVLIDYGAIPKGDAGSPGAGGHWAARFTSSKGFSATAPYNGHSPNFKNLCSDKFFNPSPGSTCAQDATVDMYGLEWEGDTALYHHFTREGRYYNGPAYLAGDGATVPYHWVHGAYFDVDTGSGDPGTIWYGVSYRGRGDTTPDTDWSYGCLCEAPGVGHMAWSATYPLSPGRTAAPPPAAPPPGGGEGASGVEAASAVAPGTAAAGALPMTSAPAVGGGAVLAVPCLAMTAAARRRRRRCGDG